MDVGRAASSAELGGYSADLSKTNTVPSVEELVDIDAYFLEKVAIEGLSREVSQNASRRCDAKRGRRCAQDWDGADSKAGDNLRGTEC